MDPFDALDRAYEPLGGSRKKRKIADIPDLTPEAESSVLADLGAGAISGLSYVGQTLDKVTGSRALRGLLGGKPRELLSVVPFSDAIGDTTENLLGVRLGTDRRDIVHGTDLIGAPRDTPLFSPEGMAGFGLEVVLDPTLPFTGFLKGGLTASGKGLKAAGGLDDVVRAASKASPKFMGPRVAKMKTTLREGLDLLDPLKKADVEAKIGTHLATKGGKIDDLLDMPLGGNLGYGIPFMDTMGTIGKAGGFGETIAHGMDKVGDVLRYGDIPGTNYSPGRHFAQLFNQPGSGGLESKIMQQAQEPHSAAIPAEKAEVLRPVYQAAEHFAKTPHDQRALMRELEGIDPPTALSQEFERIVGPRDMLAFKNYMAGVGAGTLDDSFAKYVARRGNFPDPTESIDVGGDKLLGTAHGSRIGRSDALRNMTRGSDTINDILADPMILGATKKADVLRRLQTHHSFDLPSHSPEAFDELAGIIQGFKKSHNAAATAYTGGNVPNFWVHPVVAARDAGSAAVKANKHAHSIFDGLQEAVKQGATGPTKTLGESLTAGGILHGDDVHGGLQEMARRLGMSVDDVKGLPIPKNVYDDIARMRKIFDAPGEVNKLVDGIDSITNLFKAGVLTWPARYARDLVSGQVQNILTREFSLASLKWADDFVKGKQIDALQFPIIKQMLDADGVPHTQEAANAALRAHLASIGIAHPGKGTFSQVGGTAAPRNTLESVAADIPGLEPMGLKASVKHARQGGTLNPLDVKGVFGRTETKFMPSRGGEALGNYTDSLNRLSPYLNMLKRGVDPKEAFEKVMASQVEYGNRAFTPFERAAMTRVAPFYKFSKGMLPFVMSRLADEPSGRLAQVVRGQGRMREDEQFVPSHIAQGTAMPIPGGPEGFQRYLTSLGLMHEDPLNIFRPGQNAYKTGQGTLQEVAGRLNPLAKMPLEWAAGKQLFSGRDLEDLEGNLGRIGANLTGSDEAYDTPLIAEQLLANSPLSRVATTARTLTDTRKGLGAKAVNLLSGVRTTDVDVEKSRNIAKREAIEDVLKGQSGVRHLRPHLYVKEEDMGKLSDRELAMLQIYKSLAKESQKSARSKKKKQTLSAVP